MLGASVLIAILRLRVGRWKWRWIWDLCMGYTRFLIDGMACDELATNMTLLLAYA
jgi:hypothetical protein